MNLCTSIVRSDTWSPAHNDDTMFHLMPQYRKGNSIRRRDTVPGATVMSEFCSNPAPLSGFAKPGNPLRRDLPALQMLCEYGVSGGVINTEHEPNVFHRPPSAICEVRNHRSNDI